MVAALEANVTNFIPCTLQCW